MKLVLIIDIEFYSSRKITSDVEDLDSSWNFNDFLNCQHLNTRLPSLLLWSISGIKYRSHQVWSSRKFIMSKDYTFIIFWLAQVALLYVFSEIWFSIVTCVLYFFPNNTEQCFRKVLYPWLERLGLHRPHFA